MQPRELLEDSFKQELLRDSVALQSLEGNYEEFSTFTGNDLIISEEAKALVSLGNKNASSMHVFSAVKFFLTLNELWLDSLAIKAVAPLSLLDKRDFSDVLLLRDNVAVRHAVFRVCVASGHEPKGDLVGEGGVKVFTS